MTGAVNTDVAANSMSPNGRASLGLTRLALTSSIVVLPVPIGKGVSRVPVAPRGNSYLIRRVLDPDLGQVHLDAPAVAFPPPPTPKTQGAGTLALAPKCNR